MADTVIAKLEQVKGVAVAAPLLSQEAVLRFEQQHKLVTLLGVDSRYDQLFGISDRIPIGRMVSDRGEELLLGYGTTIDLGAGLYDYDGFIGVYSQNKERSIPLIPTLCL